jgi:TetR/AcrR family hemagglutinin/protease transcriptional regulator
MPPADRRQLLLETAVRAFAERGISRASHADVARLARVSAATVFSYFRTRADLTREVLACVARYYDAMAERFHGPDRPAARALLEHAVAFATSVDSDPAYARVLLEWSTAIRDDSWPLFLRFQEGILVRCADTIRRGQAEGSIAADTDPETAALMIIGASWMVIQMSFTRWPAERVHRFVLGQLRGALGADAVARALA